MKRKILQILCLFSLSITIYIFNSCTTKPEPVTAETALQSYLQNEDQSFAWNVEESYQIDKLKVYDLRITSQTNMIKKIHVRVEHLHPFLNF